MVTPDIMRLCILSSFGRSASRGNATLSGLEDFWSITSAESEFLFVTGSGRSATCSAWPLDGAPRTWIENHRKRGNMRVDLGYLSDFLSVAPSTMREFVAPWWWPFRAGWFVHVWSGDRIELWVCAGQLRGDLFFKSASPSTYVGIEVARPLRVDTIDVAEAARGLRSALHDIDAFATEHQRGFREAFADALARLESNEPERDFVLPGMLASARGTANILAPGDHSLEARRIAAAALSADYVFRFGAMMSWQDPGPEDEATRRRDAAVTRALSTAINRCLVAAVNETPWDREAAPSKTSA